jgi:hypothetical protein
MLYSLDNPKSPAINVENFKAMRASVEEWNTVMTESTAAEFATMDLIYEIFEARNGIADQGKCDLDALANILIKSIHFPGLDSNDINWEVLHAVSLTLQVWVLPLCSDIRYLSVLSVL